VGWTSKLIVVLLILTLLSVTAFSNKQFLGGTELSSPSDWIKEEQIKVFKDKVILDIPGATWARFTNTNSMDPFIDETSNAIEVKPASAKSINVGDVISYQTSYGILIHRVIEKNYDQDGIYFLVKGDNNTLRDPFKVRFEDIKGVVVAVVY
tara:strand:+ start:3149 stop:3604 length:456 start_codon:yes stop_codon:yes gene_type:complete